MMTKSHSYALVAVAVAITVAGCSSGHTSKTANTPASTASSSSPTPTPSGSTVAQWGSLVAARSTPVLQAADKIKDCPIDTAGPGEVGNFACSIGKLTFSTNVATFGVYFTDAQATGKPDALGAPPAEIKDLVTQTNDAVKEMGETELAQEKACSPKVDSTCLPAEMAWESAKDKALATLNGWRPYTR